MASFEDNSSSFFIFYSDDFATHMSIPPAFAKKHRDFLSQASMKLAVESGRSWDVKNEQINGHFYIAGGWSDFVRDNNLAEKKLLLFNIAGDSSLDVSIFGHDCCLELPASPDSRGEEEIAVTTWRFVKEVKDIHFKDMRMDIPKRFADGTGIARSGRMKLEDERGRKWAVTVTNRNKRMYNMSSGLRLFLEANCLYPGNVLLFEFLPDSDNVVKVVALQKPEGKELLCEARAGGFLP